MIYVEKYEMKLKKIRMTDYQGSHNIPSLPVEELKEIVGQPTNNTMIAIEVTNKSKYCSNLMTTRTTFKISI